MEDSYWQNLLGNQLKKILLGKKNRSIETALDTVLDGDIDVYETLVEHAETHSESLVIEADGAEYDVLLFTAPIVAWTRYQLPGGKLTPKQRRALVEQLLRHIAAPGAQIAVAPALASFDQLPQSFQETRQWTQQLARQALGLASDTLSVRKPADTDNILADVRFLAGALVVPKGAPLFRWQTMHDDGAFISRDECHRDWLAGCADILADMFTGCQTEYLLPDAFYINCREADKRIRPYALRAAVTWLQTAAHIPPQELRAVIVGCGERNTEEYRIGFSSKRDDEVIYGCIWPVLSKEEATIESADVEHVDLPGEIVALLKEMGVSDIRRLAGIYPVDFCDDCGAPYFPNSLGSMMHPELPEETDLSPQHFH
ncbi:hypothetical protein HNQ49_000273 [Parapusillimonas granuli]|nr:hypothetical protein [Parapusillimonas granuli]